MEISNGINLVKFDKEVSKYDSYINSLDYKITNITDSSIIEFYDIDTLPTIYVYKDKNLLNTIEGFLTKSELIKKINEVI